MLSRRSAAFALALLGASSLLPAAARAHATTYSYQSSGNSQYSACETYDPVTGVYTYVYAYASSNSSHVPGGGPDDYSYGYIYYSTYNYNTNESCYAFAQVTDQSINGALTKGSMSGTGTEYCTTYDPISGTYVTTTRDVDMEVTLVGSGDLSKSKYSTHYQDPSHYNSLYSFSGSSRYAMPTFVVDGQTLSQGNAYYCYGYLQNGKSSNKVTINP